MLLRFQLKRGQRACSWGEDRVPPLLVFCFVCRVSRTSRVQTDKTVKGKVGLGNGVGGHGGLRFRDLGSETRKGWWDSERWE